MKKTNSFGFSPIVLLLLVAVTVATTSIIYFTATNKKPVSSSPQESVAGVETTKKPPYQLKVHNIFILPNLTPNDIPTGKYDFYIEYESLGKPVGTKTMPYQVKLQIGDKVYSKKGQYLPSYAWVQAYFPAITIDKLPVKITAFVDSKNQVTEYNEKDNIKTMQFVGFPDLKLTFMGFDETAVPGDFKLPIVKVENIGPGPAEMHYYLGGPPSFGIPYSYDFEFSTGQTPMKGCSNFWYGMMTPVPTTLILQKGQSVTGSLPMFYPEDAVPSKGVLEINTLRTSPYPGSIYDHCMIGPVSEIKRDNNKIEFNF